MLFMIHNMMLYTIPSSAWGTRRPLRRTSLYREALLYNGLLYNIIIIIMVSLFTTTNAQQQQEKTQMMMGPPPKSRGLTIDELNKMIDTEAVKEFNWQSSSSNSASDDPLIQAQKQETATKLWNFANLFEWNKAHQAEIERNQKYPYLLCHVGEDMSGYQRLLDLQTILSGVGDGEGEGSNVGNSHYEGGEDDLTLEYNLDTTAAAASSALQNDTTTSNTSATNNNSSSNSNSTKATSSPYNILRPLYNEEDFLCVYGQIYASLASNITGSDYIVQPILPALKFMKGSVDSMQNVIEIVNDKSEEDDENYPSLDIALCPGVATVEDSGVGASISYIEESQYDEEVLDESTAQEILEELSQQTSMAESLYFTSNIMMYDTSDITQDLAANNESSEDEYENERSQFWKSLIRDYQEMGKCVETYSTRLKWTLERSRSSSINVPPPPSLLKVQFNTTGNTPYDRGCFVLLSLAIATHPNVCSVESTVRVKTHNNVIQWLTQSELANKRPFENVGLNGEGQTVAVTDTGLDLDNCYFVNDSNGNDLKFGSHNIDESQRKVVQYLDFVDRSDYAYGHGTHVSGTIAGKRIDGEGMADGVAEGAKIAFGDIGDSNGALSLPLDSQLLNTGRPDAHVHSASWGSELNFYTTQSRNFDQFMYDNDDMLIVVAAGNSGHGDTPNTVGSPATGKNVIAVGAHHNTDKSRPRPGLGPNYVADFSSKGPTSDGRIKPDIMAPGKAVISAGARPDVIGECDPSSPPGYLGKSDGLLSLQGTSMATPVVAGTAAIVRQYFEEGYYPSGIKNENESMKNPSGALIKAVLMNSGQFLAGVDNLENGVTEIKPYDFNQGFGRISVQDMLYLPGTTNTQLTVWDRQTINDQSSQEYTVTIDKSGGCLYDKFAVTLVWIEPGSNPGCVSCLLNDLDLDVELQGKKYYPNGRNTPDRDNSVERVIIQGVKDGDVATITVTGYNLMQSSQQYSLVSTGCFGGVANTNFLNECSVFECDDSLSKRRATILMAVLIPLAAILCCCGLSLWRRRREKASVAIPSNDDTPQDEDVEGVADDKDNV